MQINYEMVSNAHVRQLTVSFKTKAKPITQQIWNRSKTKTFRLSVELTALVLQHITNWWISITTIWTAGWREKDVLHEITSRLWS